ncbi:MAG: MFS transporter [Bacteroidota bacterium]
MLTKGNKKTIRAWIMYDWANSAYALTITSAVFPIFYELVTSKKNDAGEVITDFAQEVVGVAGTSLYSYAIAAGFLIMALLAPILSGIADYSDSKKRFLQFFCYLGSAACAGLYFFSFDNLWIGLFLITMACVGFSGSIIFYNAYLPEIANEEEHDSISAKGFAAGYIGSVLLLIVNLAMVMDSEGKIFGLPGIDPEEIAHLGLSGEGLLKTCRAIQAFKISCLSVGLWWAGWAQWTFWALPNKTRKTKITNNIIFNGYREIVKVWKELGQTVRLKRYLIAYFIYNTGVQTVMFMAANFAAKEIKAKNEFGEDIPFPSESLIVAILIIQLVGAIGAFLFSNLSKRFGNLRALMIAVWFWVILVVYAYFVEYEYPFYALAAGVGLVMGGVQALSRSTYSKFLPPTHDHASYFSFYNMCYYIGTVVGMSFFALTFDLTGNMRTCIILIGSFFIIGAIALTFVPKKEAKLKFNE